MDSSIAQGTMAADIALDIMSGKDPSTLPHQTKLPIQYRVDARQLERWGFAETSLPPGTSVEIRPPAFLQQYGRTASLVLMRLTLLVGLIALLLIEFRKRKKAENARRNSEAENELRRKEVAHLVRVGIISELSGGIAHELGQPLASILANAQAAQRLIASSSDKKEIVEILEDIVEDNTRAGEVIHRLRGLLRKGEREAGQINLNDEVTSTLRLVHSELVSRSIKVQTSLDARLPSVLGDRVQLQQVFLNLVMNAMDAMASTPASRRTLIVGTRSTQNERVEVSITDRGPGMSPDQLERVFEPYFTTKQHGLGLGLSICSTIVKSHQGKLNISNADGGGVTAVVSLPVAIRLAEAS
jgi:C4-dicarboxylate-specific signal transduction histidine kinase